MHIEPAVRDEIGSLLKTAEAQLDAAIIAASSLLNAVAQLEVDPASPVSKSRSISRMASMQDLLANARMKITGVHGDLARIAVGSRDLITNCPCLGATLRVSDPLEA